MDTGDIIAGTYEIVETLGKGSYGTVYLVKEVKHRGIQWALKEIVETRIPADERDHALELFRREAEILKSLSHPGLPSIKDFFSIDERHYLVMQFIDGENLEVVKELENGQFEDQEIIDWAIQLALIIEYLHNYKPDPIVFRDLKPSNIMLTYPDRRIMLVDFGIARYFNPEKLKDTQFLGTLGFSPPEQYGRGQSDQRSDIYSYGATLYYLLTNLDMTKCAFQFTPIRKINTTVPPLFESIIMKCLSMNPGERFQSMAEILNEMDNLEPDTHYKRRSQNQEVEKADFLLALSDFYFNRSLDQNSYSPSTLKNVEKKGTFTSQEFSGLLLECHCKTQWSNEEEIVGPSLFQSATVYPVIVAANYKKQTAAMVKIEGARFPKFLMRSESFLDIRLFGGDYDIDFDDNQVFSKSFYLTGPDRKAIEKFFRPEIIETFGQDPVKNFIKFDFLTMPGTHWVVEANGPHIIFYLPGVVVSRNLIQQFIAHAQKVLLPFIRKVKSQL